MADALNLSVSDLLREVDRLRSLLTDASASMPVTWRLTSTEEGIFRALLANDYATLALIVETGVAAAGAIRVHVHRIRNKLKPFGVEIETLNGKGWRLIGRENWRAILAAKAGDQ